MKNNTLIRMLFIGVLLFISCGDDDDNNVMEEAAIRGCTDEASLNYDFEAEEEDGSCAYSKATFYARFNLFQNIPIVKIDIFIDGDLAGTIPDGFIWPNGPGNCSAAGTVSYQFTDSNTVDWNAIIYLANDATISSSGTQSPIGSIDCLKTNVTN